MRASLHFSSTQQPAAPGGTVRRQLQQRAILSPFSVFALCIAFGCSNNSSNGTTTTTTTGGQANNGGGTSASGNSGIAGTVTTGGSATASNAGGLTGVVGGSGGVGVGGSSTISIDSACLDCLTSNVNQNKCIAIKSSDLPPCANLQGKDPDTGTSNSQLCINVYNCVISNMCGMATLASGFQPANCYCGSEDGTTCLATPIGPCQSQIEQGVGSTTPTVVTSELGDSTIPTGMAMQVVGCEAQNCASDCGIAQTTTGTGGAPNAGTGGSPNATGGDMGTGGAAPVGGVTTGCPTSSSDTILFNGFAASTDGSAVSVRAGSTATAATVSWDSVAGNPDPGSVQVTIPYTKWGQYSILQGILPVAANLLNRQLFVCVDLDSGMFPAGVDPNSCATVQLEAVSSNGSLNESQPLQLCPTMTAQWLQFSWPVQASYATDPDTLQQVYAYDPTQTASIRMQITAPSTGGTPTIADAGTLLPTTATFHIDTIGYR